MLRIHLVEWRLGGSVSWASNFSSGHDLMVRGFEPHVGLCADSSEPGACLGFCVSLSLSAPFLLMLCFGLSLSLSLKYKYTFKKLKKKKKGTGSHDYGG